MSDYFLDISKVASGDGLTKSTAWNFSDVTSVVAINFSDGDNLYVKGSISSGDGFNFTVSDPTADVFNILPWDDEMSAFVFNSSDNMSSTETGQYLLNRAIVETNSMACPSQVFGVLYINSSNIYLRDASGNVGSGSKEATFRGCTFNTNDNAIVISNYHLPEVPGSPTTANFYSCLFVDTVFSNDGFYLEDEINCVNCTFIGKTEAQVKADFEDTGCVITFTDCRFSVSFPSGSPTFPSSAGELTSPTSKSKLFFDSYNDGSEDFEGVTGYDYTTDGYGLFGGERRGVGAWWFSNSYIADLSTQNGIGTGDGLTVSDRMGWGTLQDFMDGLVNSGRYLRERDKILCQGTRTFDVSDTIVFPSALTSLGVFSGTPYQGVYVESYDNTPFVINKNITTALNSVAFGQYNRFERMITDVKDGTSGMEANDFVSCLLFSEDYIEIDTNLTKNMRFIGCSFTTPEVRFKGTGVSFDIEFLYCVFANRNGTLCTFGEMTSPGSYRIHTENCRFETSQTLVEVDLLNGTMINDASTIFEADFDYNFPNDITTYTQSELRFDNYDAAGSLQLPTVTYEDDTDFGLWNNLRVGAGAFFFNGIPGDTSYYADLSSGVIAGLGTEVSPWNISQFREYFDGTPGYTRNTGDVINCKGPAEINTVNYIPIDLFDFKREITIRSWDLETNGPVVFYLDSILAGQDVNFFYNMNGGTYGDSLELSVKDFVILAPTSSCNSLSIIRATADYSVFELFNSLIISDVAFSVISNNSEDTEMYNHGVTLSIGENASTFNYGGLEMLFEDSVLNINSAVTISRDIADSVDLNYCEINRTSVDMDATASSNSTFESTKPTLIPETLDFVDFAIELFVYKKFGFTNAGQGLSYQVTNGYPTGIGSLERAGIGAFYFLDRVLYADGSASVDGVGTEVNPFSYSQVVNYFNPDIGTDCFIEPINEDVLNMKGIFDSSVYESIFNIKRNVSGKITVKPWDISNNGLWIIETKNLPDTTDITFIGNTTGYEIDDLIIDGFVFLQNTGSTGKAILSDLIAEMNIKLTNFMIFGEGDINLGVDDNIVMNCYGFTIRGLDVDFTSFGELYMYDGVVHSSTLTDNT